MQIRFPVFILIHNLLVVKIILIIQIRFLIPIRFMGNYGEDF